MIRVLVAGEGPNEVGGELEGKPGRPHLRYDGVVQVLCRRIAAEAGIEVEIVDAKYWKDIKRHRVRETESSPHEHDAARVHGLVLHALEADPPYDAVVFVRDSDGVRERAHAVTRATQEARDLWGHEIAVAGGVAVQQLESWLYAFLGKGRSERARFHAVAAYLAKHGIEFKCTANYTELVGRVALHAVPKDAASWHAWHKQVRAALGADGGE